MTTDLPLPERSAADEAAEWLPDGLVAVTAPGLIESVNAVALRITGLTREQVVGAPLEVGLPLRDHEGRAWWEVASPFNGLDTRTGHRTQPELCPRRRNLPRHYRPERGGKVYPCPACGRDLARAGGCGAPRWRFVRRLAARTAWYWW